MNLLSKEGPGWLEKESDLICDVGHLINPIIKEALYFDSFALAVAGFW